MTTTIVHQRRLCGDCEAAVDTAADVPLYHFGFNDGFNVSIAHGCEHFIRGCYPDSPPSQEWLTFTVMASTYTETVSAEVRAEMARQRIGQVKLADLLGWSQAGLSRRLRGEVAFSTDELEAVAATLDVPVSQFVSPPAKAAAS